MDFIHNYKVMECGAPVAAGNAIDDNSDIIDMLGYQSAIFICTITDSVETAIAVLTIEQNDADSDTGMSALSGALAIVGCDADDDLNGKLLVVEIINPKKRYIQAVRTSQEADIAFGPMIVLLGGSRTKPVDEDSTIADMVIAIAPDEV